MINLSKNDYNYLLNNCRCKACICENSCFENGLKYGDTKECKDNTCLIKSGKQVINKAKTEVKNNYRY